MHDSLLYRCKILDNSVKNEIRWLGIEEADGEYYLLQFEDINYPPKWDAVYTNLDELFDDCEHTWDIKKEDWVVQK